MKTIYELLLHETLTLPCGTCIMRVASGWVYDWWDSSNDCPKTGLFIPFDNSFQTIGASNE